jgi:ketosteroid isomerase-like protein
MSATFVVIGFALLLGACSGNEADPAGVLADYQEARNSGDVDAVLAFYAEDAVVKDHPRDDDGIANGVDEIRSLEAPVPEIQGSAGGIEFTDMVVSGDTVTFNHKFFIADGACFGGLGGQITVEDGKITLYDWGPEDPSQCG